MAVRKRRLRDELLTSFGIACAVLVGLYGLGSMLVFELDHGGSCDLLDDQPGIEGASQPRIRGELRWNWLPPTAECAWALDERGEPVGPPDGRSALRTEPEFDPFIAWGVLASAAIALTALAVALGRPTRRIRLRSSAARRSEPSLEPSGDSG